MLGKALCSLEDVVLIFPAGSVGSGSKIVKLVLSVWLEQVPVSLEAAVSLLPRYGLRGWQGTAGKI